MSVRLKISLLIAFAGFFSGLVFSSWMIRDIVHEYSESIDHELKSFSINLVDILSSGGDTAAISPFENNRFWIEVYKDKDKYPIFRSRLAENVRLEKRKLRGSWNEIAEVGADIPYIRRSRDNTAVFHGIGRQIERNGATYTVYAALAMDYMKGEAIELITGLAGGLTLAIVLYFCGSYFIAGLILKPVRSINRKTRNITEKQLHTRLPSKDHGRRNDEFNELAITLNGLFDRLENAFNRQKRLIDDVSHELKTPLSIMRLASDNISRKVYSSSYENIPVDAERLSEQVMRMDRLVKNILNLSSLEMINSVNRTPVDISKMVRLLAEDYRILAEARNINIVCEVADGLVVKGDEDKLSRAVSNILDNAVKYSSGTVEIYGRPEKGAVIIEVTNSGDFIPQPDVDKIFDEFFRVEQSRSSDSGGAGLGLSIVRRIAELHDGTVSFESSADGKITVRLTFPSK
ncbi:MAG: sensor histidine kinase [Deferribacterales bacterium]